MVTVNSMTSMPIALISGVIRNRIIDRITTGSVGVSPPCRKSEVTTSSNENVNASRPAATIAGSSAGQRHPPEHPPRGGAQVGGGLLERGVERRHAAPG